MWLKHIQGTDADEALCGAKEGWIVKEKPTCPQCRLDQAVRQAVWDEIAEAERKGIIPCARAV